MHRRVIRQCPVGRSFVTIVVPTLFVETSYIEHTCRIHYVDPVCCIRTAHDVKPYEYTYHVRMQYYTLRISTRTSRGARYGGSILVACVALAL